MNASCERLHIAQCTSSEEMVLIGKSTNRYFTQRCITKMNQIIRNQQKKGKHNHSFWIQSCNMIPFTLPQGKRTAANSPYALTIEKGQIKSHSFPASSTDNGACRRSIGAVIFRPFIQTKTYASPLRWLPTHSSLESVTIESFKFNRQQAVTPVGFLIR